MKRPSFQFYPADWRNNAKLRRCSEAARGVWMDILCVLHDSDEYGVCRWPLADLARAANASFRLVKELADKEVLKGSDSHPEAYVFTPRHAGKDGEPVTLVATQVGKPCWYSSRLVRDEWVRLRRGSSTQFTADNQPPKVKPKSQPKGGIGERQGDGPTSSSTSSGNSSNEELQNHGADAPCDWRAMFAEFWQNFPQGFGDKGSRKNAEAQFLKLKPDEPLFARMLAALAAQTADKTAKTQAGQFAAPFQHVERWLRNRRWEDEITSTVLGGRPHQPTATLIDRHSDTSWAEGAIHS